MKNEHPKGFMAIVAIGVFALLMIFGLTLQKRTMRTYESIKDGLNYATAGWKADSIMEFLQYELNSHDVGYNSGDIVCQYKNAKLATNTDDKSAKFCAKAGLEKIVGTNDVTVKLTIKGREGATEKLKTSKCGGLFGFNNDCYVVPFPGTGNAGKNCNLYEPSFDGEVGATTVPPNLANGDKSLDQADFSCNWNKLTFGSSQTARVALPLYYEGASDPDGDGIGELVNPYKTGGPAKNLILRLRTPCLPCVYDPDKPVDGVSRTCEKGDNTTICEDGERYELDTLTDDKVVVQWQLSGKCEEVGGGTKDCSVLPIAGNKKSAIFESVINLSKDKGTYKAIDNETTGNDVSVHPPVKVSFLYTLTTPKLSQMTQPILNIFLSGKLLTDVSGNVPYLEYQLLTDEPVGMPFYKLEADVMVNGNAFIKTLYKEIKKDLVDFAIKN